MKFSALVLFIPLWVTFVYFPIAHMVWYWAGPAATVGAAKTLAAATGDAKAAAQTAMDAVTANAGLAFGWAHSTSPAARWCTSIRASPGLMGALLVGRRVGYGKEAMPPHSLTMTLVGAALLWVGWFSFNAGSASRRAARRLWP